MILGDIVPELRELLLAMLLILLETKNPTQYLSGVFNLGGDGGSRTHVRK